MASTTGLSDAQRRILETIRQIPRGRVTTYGRVAERAGLPRRARLVASTLRRVDEPDLPWFRVIGAGGRIVFPPDSPGFQRQSERLRTEGVIVERGRIDLERFGWNSSELPLLDP